MENVEHVRLKAWKLCKKFLQGAWIFIQPEEVVVTEISGGLCNLMYHCSLPENVKPIREEPREVLLRIFGKSLQDQDPETAEAYLTGLIIESVIFTLLSERNLGPKLVGIFNGGRLEEYIPSKSMNDEQLQSKIFCAAVARKLAKFHKLEVPIEKDPEWLFKTMLKWLSNISKTDYGNLIDSRDKSFAEEILAFDFESEISWLRNAVKRVNSPLVFCHNDFQKGNILVRNDYQDDDCQSIDEAIVVIDYEFCSYNFRGFDIANHLCEWMYDYTLKDYPFFTFQSGNFPSEEKQLEFLQIYLSEFIQQSGDANGSVNIDGTLESSTLNQHVQSLYQEVKVFYAVANLVWALWSISNAAKSKIVFGNWSYASLRLQQYLVQKKRILEETDLTENKM